MYIKVGQSNNKEVPLELQDDYLTAIISIFEQADNEANPKERLSDASEQAD